MPEQLNLSKLIYYYANQIYEYSYVKLIEDGSKVAGLLELYGTNDYTQAVTINGYTQSGRGTFYVNGDKVTLSRTSGIAIDGVLDITKGSDNKHVQRY